MVDYNIANQSGAQLRAELNLILAALQCSAYGATAPTTTTAGQVWVDSSGASPVLNLLNALNNGQPRQSIVQSFINSPEFVSTYGNLNNTAFVNLVYQTVLGRAPDSGGLTFWVGQLNAGMTRGDMMYSFVVSPEFVARIQNRALATLLYMGFLRRSPEPAGLAFWINALNNGLAGANAIEPFINSVEYILRF